MPRPFPFGSSPISWPPTLKPPQYASSTQVAFGGAHGPDCADETTGLPARGRRLRRVDAHVTAAETWRRLDTVCLVHRGPRRLHRERRAGTDGARKAPAHPGG